MDKSKVEIKNPIIVLSDSDMDGKNRNTRKREQKSTNLYNFDIDDLIVHECDECGSVECRSKCSRDYSSNKL